MGRTLADDIRDDFQRVFLNTEHFAVEGVYTPKDGTPRTITVQSCGMSGAVRQESHHLTNDRMLVIWAMRDVTDGIDNPQVGDTWEQDDTLFSFDGVYGESSNEFALKFKKIDRVRTGSMTNQRL